MSEGRIRQRLLHAGLLLFLAAPAWAQSMTLRVPTVQAQPGTSVQVPVYLDHNGPTVDGWSYGVCSDPTQVTLSSVVDGADTIAPCGGNGPFFNSIVLYPDGFTVGYVID